MPDRGAWKPWSGVNADLYNKNDTVTHNGRRWEALVGNNHWEPGAAGSETLWRDLGPDTPPVPEVPSLADQAAAALARQREIEQEEAEQATEAVRAEARQVLAATLLDPDGQPPDLTDVTAVHASTEDRFVVFRDSDGLHLGVSLTPPVNVRRVALRSARWQPTSEPIKSLVHLGELLA